jgi:hypothetical protein
MEELDLYGTVNGVVCALDSINYLSSPQSLSKAFSRVSLFLEQGGLFIFDVNTEKKLRDLTCRSTRAKRRTFFVSGKHSGRQKSGSAGFILTFLSEKITFTGAFPRSMPNEPTVCTNLSRRLTPAR